MIRSNKWLIFLFIAVGIFMSTLDGSIVNITLPIMTRDLSTSIAKIEWVVMIYLLTVTCLLLSFGRLSDIKGRRWVYVRGLLAFSIGSFLCAISHTVFSLIAARAFQGIGAAMIMACTPALVVDIFPPSERGKALGFVGSVVALGLTIGPALGGLIVHFLSWRYIFIINIPIGVTAAVLSAIILKGGQADIKREESFDWPGAICLSCALGLFLFVLSHGYKWGYYSFQALGFFFSAIIFSVALIIIESRTRHPLFELSLFSNRLFIMPVISAIILFAGLFNIVFLMPFYLIHPCGFEMDKIGFIMVSLFAGLFVFSPISGMLSDKMGSRFLCTLGMVLLSGAMYFISILPAAADTLTIVWRLSLAGIGTAIFISPNSSIALSSVPTAYRGIAASTVASARNLGMVIGVAIAGAIFNTVYHRLSGGFEFKTYHPRDVHIFMESFRIAMATGTLIAIIGVFVTFLRGRDNPPENNGCA